MSKYLKIFFLAMLVVTLLVTTALAGTTTVNHLAAGSNILISAQALGADRNFLLEGQTAGNIGTGTFALEYQLGQQLTSGNFIVVTFDSGIAYRAGQYAVCAGATAAANNVVAVGTPGANATTYNFQVGTLDANANIAAGNKLWITNDTTCNTATSKDLPLKVIANSTGNKNVTISGISAGNIPSDSANSKRIATIGNEFAVTLTAADAVTIDYVNAPANGTRFTAGNVAGSSNKISITQTLQNLGAATNVVGGASNNAGLTATLMINLSDSQGWQGVNKIYAANAVGCPASSGAAVGAINAPASGNASINASTIFNGSAGANVSVCIEVTGTSALQTRTINGNYTIGFTTNGGVAMPTSTTAAYQNWTLNAYQGLIPWLVKSDGFKTYCVVNNNSTDTANLWLTTFSSETGTSIASLQMGTLAAGKTQLYVFGNDVVAGTNTYSLTGLTDGDRYSAFVTVATNRDSVTMSCNQFDPNGAKRPVAVLTDNAGSKWKQ